MYDEPKLHGYYLLWREKTYQVRIRIRRETGEYGNANTGFAGGLVDEP